MFMILFSFSLSLFKVCPKVIFELYDGYEWKDEANNISSTSSSFSTSSYLRFSVSDLPECLQLCLSNEQCVGVNYNGHTCQQVLQDNVKDGEEDDSENIFSKLTSTIVAKSFNIHAHKICLTGKLFVVIIYFILLSSTSYINQIIAIVADNDFGHLST